MTPVLLPYLTLEKVEQPLINTSSDPKKAQEQSKALLEQTNRNIGRLETARFFGKWFAISFSVFIMSSLLLSTLFVLSFFKKPSQK